MMDRFIRFFANRELEVIIGVAAVTMVVGSLVARPVEGFFVSCLELLAGVGFAFMRQQLTETRALRREVAKANKVIGHLSSVADSRIIHLVEAMTANLAKLARQPLLLAMAKTELEKSGQIIGRMGAGQGFTKWAITQAERIQHSFESYLLALPPGCQYDTVSNFDFWSPAVLERLHDFARINFRAAEGGVQINRVLVIPDRLTPEQEELLAYLAQLEARSSGRLRTRIHAVEDYSLSKHRWGNFAVCRNPQHRQTVVLSMHYRPETWEFERLEVVTEEERMPAYEQRFDDAFETAVPIMVWLAPFSRVPALAPVSASTVEAGKVRSVGGSIQGVQVP